MPQERTVCRATTLGLLLWFVLLSPWGVGDRSPAQAAEPPDPGIQVLSSGSGTVRLELVPDQPESFVCTGCEDLVRVQVDGNEVPYDIQPAGDGAAVTASFSGLEDGRHKATGASLGSGGETLARREALFLVDSRPPELDLLEPGTARIQPTQTAFLVRCRDDGSGLSPDPQASGLSVTVGGRAASYRAVEERGELVLIIAADVARWEPSRTVSLHVEARDRAGNTASLDRSFEVVAPEDEWGFEVIDCVPGDMQRQGLYVLRRIPFPLQTSVHWIRFDEAERSAVLSLQLSTLEGEPLDPGVYDALEVTSGHPCIRVERLHRSPAASAVDFRVRQVSLPKGGDGLGSVTVQYPAFVAFDHALGCEGAEPQAAIRGMRAEGDLRRYAIPVALHARSDYSDEVRVEEERLRYRFLLTGPGALDTAASWFELEGARAWLSPAGEDAYEASVPVDEGLHLYTAQLALSLWGWGGVPGGEVSEDGRSLLKTGEIFVTLDPPRIEHFHYDRENERFRAMVSDQGTALEDLELRLHVSGTGAQDPGFDPATGAVGAPCPLPEGVQAALLEVTDRAGQTTTASCTVFGLTPGAHSVKRTNAPYPATIKEGGRSEARRPPSNPSSWRLSRRYTGVYQGGKEAVTECIETTLPVTKEDPLTRCLKRVRARYGTTTLPLGAAGSSLKATQGTPAQNPALERAERACKEKYPPGQGYHWDYEPAVECRDTWVDTLPPRIRDAAFLPAGRRISALIDDHGMPLSQVRVEYAIDPSPQAPPRRQVSRPFSFDTSTGLFAGEAPPGREAERFQAEIRASDAAGNWSTQWLDVQAPFRPPEVSLEVTKRGDVAYPLGTCSDGSGLDHRKTRAWLDGRRVAPVGVRYGTDGSPDRVDFGPVGEEGPHRARLEVTDHAGLSAEAAAVFRVALPPEIERFRHLPGSLQKAGGPAFSAVIRDRGGDLDLRGIELSVDGDPVDPGRFYHEPGSGYFAADGPLDLPPGPHRARLKATDAHGHSDEAFLRFVPGERLDVHGPETDDLSVEEVTLWELQDHNGDGRANPGETVRLFVSLTHHGSARLEAVSGRLESGEPDIVVEEDEVAYGTIEPGGTISPLRGFDVRIDEGFLDTRPAEPCEARFALEAVDGSRRTRLLDLELPVYRPTLPVAVPPSHRSPAGASPADPADPNAPDPPAPVVSEVTVTLDALPAGTEEAEIEVSGTVSSTASTVDEVVVRVNGTEHTAAWDPAAGTFAETVPLDLGDNLIEAEAVDRTGAAGVCTCFVHRSEPFVPPEIEIAEPAGGDAFLCAPVFLRGSFDAGSSEVSAIQCSMSAEGESVSVPIDHSGDGAFLVGAGGEQPLNLHFRPGWGHNHVTTITVTVILTTTDGDTVEDTVTFTYVCWS